MKKFLVYLILLALVIAGFFIFTKDNKKETKYTNIKVGEVTHSIFYAPQYAADALGYFKDEGLNVDFILTAGAVEKK